MKPCVLVIAGSDSSGGAGVLRDAEAVIRLGLRASVAVTAVTAQTDRRVVAVGPMPPRLVEAQMETALESGAVAAVKIGMLAARGIVETVASVLRRHAHIPVVLDPVLVASSGRVLLENDAIAPLKRDLLPLCRLITPNWPELAVLSDNAPAPNEEEALRQADLLLDAGCGAVLVKGGHAPDAERSTDILVSPNASPRRFDAPRINASLRGSGCMLASGIAAGLAAGRPLAESIDVAKAEVLRSFRAECGGACRPEVPRHSGAKRPKKHPRV